MPNFNKVILVGHLCRDPELRLLPNGTPKCEMRLAVNRNWAKDGEKQQEVCYVDVVAWSRQAETCKEYLAKGRAVLVEGRLSYQEWEGKDGGRRSKHEVVADRVQFLGGERGDGDRGGYSRPADKPYGGEKNMADAMGVSDRDLPF